MRRGNEGFMPKQFTKTHSNMAKGLAILLLLVYHLFENEELITSMGVNHAPFSLEGFLLFSGFGNICVAVFVFLTAFGIAAGLFAGTDGPTDQRFWKTAYGQAAKRFFRLMLRFALLYLSVTALWWHKFDYASLYGADKQGGLLLLTDALGLSMFFGTPTLNATWWYMEIAYLLIFLVPLLTWLTAKMGYPILLAAFLLPHAVAVQPDLKRYLFAAVFGVCAAYGRWPERLLNLKVHRAVQWTAGILGFALCVLIRQNFMVHEYYIHLVDAPVALFLVYVATALLGSLPVLGKALAFLGEYSMNIYLVHTFFYQILWRQQIYRFRYAGITFLLLLCSCLLYSVALEGLKRIVRTLWKRKARTSG